MKFISGRNNEWNAFFIQVSSWVSQISRLTTKLTGLVPNKFLLEKVFFIQIITLANGEKMLISLILRI